jgi:tetratricopeptide (TPR) repeat protein
MMSSAVSSSSRRLSRTTLLPLAAVFALTAIAFVPAIFNQFVNWDDEQTLTGNVAYRGLSARELRWMWTTFHTGHYQPLTWMTWGVDYLVWGLNPAGYHLGNVVLHALNATLVGVIATRLFVVVHPERLDSLTARAFGVAAGLLFGVHPLRVESVAWATERRDVLSAFFFLLALLAYLRHASSPRRGAGRSLALGAAVVLFACALLSKAITMTLPAVLLILDIYPLRRVGGSRGWWSPETRRVYLEKLPFAILAGAAALLAPRALGHMPQLSVARKLAVSSYSFAFYLWKTILPRSLSPLYEMPANVIPTEPRYLVGYAVVISAGVLAWKARRHWPSVSAGLAAYTVTALPVLGVVQNGPQITADRYAYLPGVALGVLGAAGIWWLAGRAGRSMAVAVGVVLVSTLGSLTWRQVHVWHDTATLWAHAVALDASSPVARENVGLEHFRAGDLDGAIREFRRAVELKPASPTAHVNWGVALARQGHLDSAVNHYRMAYALDSTTDDALVNWGVALQEQGRAEEAIDLFRRAADAAESGRASSRYLADVEASAHANWGLSLARLGRDNEAIEHFSIALRLAPLNQNANNNLGVVLARVGRTSEAVQQYRRALELDSSNTEARINLGNALVRESRFSEAIGEYRRAASSGTAGAEVAYNWGVALAKMGRLNEAYDKFKEALDKNPDDVAARESLARLRVMLGRAP